MAEVEQRRHARRALDVAVRAFHDQNGLEGDSRVIDLSFGGFALVAPIALPPGESLGFRLRLAEGTSLDGTAEVRWHQPAGTPGAWVHGLEFGPLPFWQRRKLSGFLSPRPARSFSGVFDVGLALATALVVLYALRDYWTAHFDPEGASWAIAPSCLVAGLLGWALSRRYKTGG